MPGGVAGAQPMMAAPYAHCDEVCDEVCVVTVFMLIDVDHWGCDVKIILGLSIYVSSSDRPDRFWHRSLNQERPRTGLDQWTKPLARYPSM